MYITETVYHDFLVAEDVISFEFYLRLCVVVKRKLHHHTECLTDFPIYGTVRILCLKIPAQLFRLLPAMVGMFIN